MKSALRILALGMLLLVPFAAYAQAPSVSVISDVSVNVGATATVNVVAVSLVNDAITLTSSLPSFCTLNAPTTGTGLVITTLTLAPTASDVGTFAASVTATAGSLTDIETFQITVNAAGSDVAPVVVAPATFTGTEGSNISFTVTASDADAQAITTFAASMPAGATFTPNGTNTSGTFSWTPSLSQAGDYDVVFTASNALSGAATTHIHVNEALVITAISDLTVAEGATATVNVHVTGPIPGTIALTSSLPGFATLNAPTSITGNGTLNTTISIAPGTGSAGSYPASITATATVGDQQVTETFNITVTTAGGGGTATARMLGQFNTHRKFICFRVSPNGSFDARNVDLASVHLVFNGLLLSPLSSRTKIDLDCDDDDGDEGDCDRGEDCEECNNGDDDHDGDTDTTGCVATLRACFSTGVLVTFFGDADLPGALANATIEGSLTTGGTFVATFDASKLTHHDNGHHGLNIKARPNPLNPATKITFTLSQPGRVRVAVYDMQGRMVSKLLDENRAAGEHTLSWDGSNSRNQRVASGVYFFRIEAPQGRDFKQVAVLK
ncbi:MAG TPA: FlgD immunoglobulin-like domain containing protein [Candidatus Limnocylindrales bacterium]|nr:FlgD immunoglobulin-like domain containing protein [Candidatus Limnocylindrales bacterium]